MYVPHQSNLAYDFDLFDNEEIDNRRKAREQKSPKIGMIKNSVARNGNFVKILIVAACAVALPGYYLMSKAEVSALSSEINAKTVLYEEAKREKERLQSELDNLYTLTKVEECAVNELGLEKIKPIQENYVVLNVENLTEIASSNDDDPFAKIEDITDGLLEYLGF